ncbi:hypothetical protein Tco_0424267 [Tanacetum coccineum]
MKSGSKRKGKKRKGLQERKKKRGARRNGKKEISRAGFTLEELGGFRVARTGILRNIKDEGGQLCSGQWDGV